MRFANKNVDKPIKRLPVSATLQYLVFEEFLFRSFKEIREVTNLANVLLVNQPTSSHFVHETFRQRRLLQHRQRKCTSRAHEVA